MHNADENSPKLAVMADLADSRRFKGDDVSKCMEAFRESLEVLNIQPKIKNNLFIKFMVAGGDSYTATFKKLSDITSCSQLFSDFHYPSYIWSEGVHKSIGVGGLEYVAPNRDSNACYGLNYVNAGEALARAKIARRQCDYSSIRFKTGNFIIDSLLNELSIAIALLVSDQSSHKTIKMDELMIEFLATLLEGLSDSRSLLRSVEKMCIELEDLQRTIESEEDSNLHVLMHLRLANVWGEELKISCTE